MSNLKIFTFFFVAAIADTLLHECGHALVALWFGFHPHMHYAYTYPLSDGDWQAVQEGLLKYKQYPHSIWITLGGPIQTALTGTIGLLALIVLNNRTKIDTWNTKHLFWIVLSFFHSRIVFNLLSYYARINTSALRGNAGDETKLFNYWGVDNDTGHMVLLLVSLSILGYVTFFLIKKHRWQLVVLGGGGSFAGGVVWLYWWWPLLLP